MVLKKPYLLLILLLACVLLTSCEVEKNQQLQFPSSLDDDIVPSPMPTPYQEKVLSVCLGDEPTSLFIYGDLSRSANIIRQAIYDGPIDQVDFQFSAPLLSEMPSQENGFVTISPVEVFPGEKIADAKGNPTLLTSGVEYRPTGCLYPECWQVYQDQTPILLDQVEIIYPLKSGITWSDGVPLTTLDSVYSFQVATELYGASGPRKLQFAADYQQTEEGNIKWVGIPGYLGIYDYSEYLFAPLPEHKLGNLSAAQLLTTDDYTQQLLGWGPYQIKEWDQGDHITLRKNKLYHLSGEGLPVYDALVFRFVDGGEEALAAYSSGECQIVLNEPDLYNYISDIEKMKEDGEVVVSYYESTAWEQISYGINSLDQGVNLISEPLTRKALSQCIDRDELAANRDDAGNIVHGLYHQDDPRNNTDVEEILFQPQEAVELLIDLGWIDHDQDPETPRIADGVKNVADGKSFQVTLLYIEDIKSSSTAMMIKDQLQKCGVELLAEPLTAGELLAPGPDGPVFGRRFDLALFAWSTGNYHLCQIFHTDEIPGQYPSFPKGMGGANAPGYSVQLYDAACDILTTGLPDSDDTLDSLAAVQKIFKEDMPVLPLFFRKELILSKPNIKGFNSGNYSPLWNIEDLR